jgi:hypothetical protein
MDKEEKELLEKFRKLLPENKINYLVALRMGLSVQENTKKALGISAAPEKGRKTA